MKTLETIKVVLDATSEPLKKTIQTARREIDGFAKTADSQTKKVGAQMDKTASPAKRIAESIKEMNRQIKAFSAQAQVDAGIKKYTDDYLDLQSNIRLTGKSLEDLTNQAETFSDTDKFEMSQEFKEIQEQVEAAKLKLEEFVSEKNKMESDAMGAPISHWDSYKKLQKDIEETTNEIKYLEGEMEAMKSDGTDKVETRKWKSIKDSIAQARAERERYKAAAASQEASGAHIENVTKGFSSGSNIQAAVATAKSAVGLIGPAFSSAQRYVIGLKNSVAGVVQQIPFIGRLVTESSYLAKKGFSLMSFAASKVGAGILRAGGAAASLIKRFASGLPIIRNFTGQANRMGMTGRGLGGIFRTIGMSARFMFASFVIMGAINSAKEGFQNLSKESSTTNANLSLLKTQLAQLKNSLATAFEPILSIVTPYLSHLIDMIIGATNAIAQFFAALTGKTSYNVAKRVNKDYAAGLNDSADAANNANKANQDLKRTLMGFDEVNKLDDSSDSGSAGSGGGSGSSGGDLFATETVGSQFSNMVDMVKEAWKNADFTGIGTIIGGKINSMLEGIPWDGIKTTAGKIAKSVATFLNGAIGEIDWNLVGKTVAEGINTALEFGYNFVTTFDWTKLGKAIGDSINGLIENIDWVKAGKTLSDGFKGILDTISTALETVDWKQVGKSVGEFLTNIDWSGALASAGEVVVNAFIAVLDFTDGLFESICDGIKDVDWLEVAKDAWDLFKDAWELVGVVISVAISLVKSGWSLISSFVGTIVTVAVSLIKAGWTTIISFIGNVVSVAISLIKKGWSKLSNFIGTTVSVGVKLAKKGWKSLKDWIGGLTQTLKLKLPKIKIDWGTKKFAGWEIKYPKGFKTYATGGFPEEGPFYMNRGEIAGKFSNGKGVVANNQQITTGIANAVGPAVYAAMMAAMQANGGNASKVVVTIEPDAKGIFRIVRTEAQNYTNSHGVSPFPV